MENLEKCLKSMKIDFKFRNYFILSRWVKDWKELIDIEIPHYSFFNSNPFDIYKQIFEYYIDIADKQKITPGYSISKLKNQSKHGKWIEESIIYSMYIRSAMSWDHDKDGVLGNNLKDRTLNREGIRETGTFMKALFILPYLKNMGIDTIYLLPIASIGKYDKKGVLGSPYAQKNPFKIEEHLADTLFDVSAKVQFAAFVEACHALDLRVMIDFIFRTTSKDSDWIKDHPDWFYWIDQKCKKNYKAPEFSHKELDLINKRVLDLKNNNMIPPHKEYIDMFSIPNKAVQYNDEDGYYSESEDGRKLIIPGAFADWPPNDVQPPWTDVTYLKLYDDIEFNYIAYNTIRMYDRRIKKPNEELWEHLTNIIPFYQKEFGIDGARIDMGHALPHQLESNIINKARDFDSDFAFLSENFNPKGEKSDSGYNAVWGSAWFMQHRIKNDDTGLLYVEDDDEDYNNDKDDSKKNTQNDNIHKGNRLLDFIKEIPTNPLPVLGAPETFDTPRIASRKNGRLLSKLLMRINFTLPGVIPFLNAGIEFYEPKPTNLGLDFSERYIQKFVEELALFDRSYLDWFRKPINIKQIQDLSSMRKKYLLHSFSEQLKVFTCDNGIWGYYYMLERKQYFVFLANTSNQTLDLDINDINSQNIPDEVKIIIDEHNSSKANGIVLKHLESIILI